MGALVPTARLLRLRLRNRPPWNGADHAFGSHAVRPETDMDELRVNDVLDMDPLESSLRSLRRRGRLESTAISAEVQLHLRSKDAGGRQSRRHGRAAAAV